MNEPSAQLIALVERLRLVTAGQVLSHRPQVRRLAGELGFFDTVWIDALAQARLLTPFQAREINAGRGDALEVGPLVLLRPIASLGFADCFAARQIESGEAVRLYLIGKTHSVREIAQRQLAELAERSGRLARGHLLPIQATGVEGERMWATTPPCNGESAGDWMVENGRFPAAVVLPIAQAMTAALVELAAQSIVHGDISASSLLVERGRVLLAHPGLRGIVRPAEGYAHHDLFPAAYDYLAPERIAAGTPPTVAGDMYACGDLWWHLLTGRPPFAGGNNLTKLQAVHAARTVDVRRLAPETPERLAAAIGQCLSREPGERPASFERLAAALGPPGRAGAAALARLQSDRQRVRSMLGSMPDVPHRGARNARRALTVAAAVALVTAACWPAWRRGDLLPRFAIGRTKSAARSQAATTAGSPLVAAPAGADSSSAAASGPAAGKNVDRSAKAVAYWTREQAPALVLPADRKLSLDRLSLRPGQLVRGEPGARPQVLVPARGLSVAVEDVTFENIDFVADATAAATGGMIAVSAARAQFHGCSFRGDSAAPRTARPYPGEGRPSRGVLRPREAASWCCEIAWSATWLVPSKLPVRPGFRLRWPTRCLPIAPRSCGLRRTANLDPAGDLLLEHVTARETGPVVHLDGEATARDAGLLTITANESTFALCDGAPLVLVGSEVPLESLAERIEWQGQGSLVTIATPVAAWRTPDGKLQPIADEQLSVAGLVRSQVQFAGQSATDSASSRTVRWQVPLQSAEPPGIGDDLP